MAEAGDGLLGLALALHVGGDIRRLADLLGHGQHIFRRTAVRGSRQGRNRRRDGRVDIGLRAHHDARRERGCIGAVLSMQHEIGVEKVGRVGGGLLPLQHPQEVGGVRQACVRCHRRVPLADAGMGCDDHGHLAGEPDALAQRRRP